jgi:hypothetical protein
MPNPYYKLAAFGLMCAAAIAVPALAQPPAAAPAATPIPATDPLNSPAPHYVSIKLSVDVNKSAADTWARVGKFCDIGEWLLRNPAGCTITAGAAPSNDFGMVRSVAGEILVGMTPLSYTYTQTVMNGARAGRPYNLYHGTVEARPVTATTSKLVYTLFFDNSMLASDAARDADIAQKTTQFQGALNNMKIIAEGGTLPPPPARAGGAGGGAGRGAAPGGPAPGR